MPILEHELQWLKERGWRESVLANGRGWWIDPAVQGLVLYTFAEATALQQKRDREREVR